MMGDSVTAGEHPYEKYFEQFIKDVTKDLQIKIKLTEILTVQTKNATVTSGDFCVQQLQQMKRRLEQLQQQIPQSPPWSVPRPYLSAQAQSWM